MSNGYGMLTITEKGQTFARFAVAEGANLVTEIDGRTVAFALQRAPELEHYDIRKMSSEAIAKFLASKLEGEAMERDFEADLE